jgi:hypothetical protein
MNLEKCVLVNCPWSSNHGNSVKITTKDSMGYQTTHYIPSRYAYRHSPGSYVIIPKWLADNNSIDWSSSNYLYDKDNDIFLSKEDIRDLKINMIIK